MDKGLERISSSLTDTLKARTIRQIDRLKVTIDRISSIDDVIAAELNKVNAAVEILNNSVAVMSAGQSHKMEENELLWNVASELSNIGTIVASLKPIMQADEDFMLEHLTEADAAVFQAAFNKLEPTRQRELLPELFMGGN